VFFQYKLFLSYRDHLHCHVAISPFALVSKMAAKQIEVHESRRLFDSVLTVSQVRRPSQCVAAHRVAMPREAGESTQSFGSVLPSASRFAVLWITG